MKYFYLLFLSAFLFGNGYAQKACSRKSPLFQFDPQVHARLFTEKLGNHPQFPFLQRENGITTPALFIKSVKDAGSREKYPDEFKIFDALLKDIGFKGGYKDLHLSNIKNSYVNDGTLGNLGFYNKEKPDYNYIYVRLNPAGEGRDGVRAWKITGPSGCYFYILHTCGNAFYPSHQDGDCCRLIQAETRINPLELAAEGKDRPLHVKINFYKAIIYYSGHRKKDGKKGPDTLVSLIRSIDTTTIYHDSIGKAVRVSAREVVNKFMVCRDTVWQMRPVLVADSLPGAADSMSYVLSDTVYLTKASNGEVPCHKKWEISLDGGVSYNAIPRFDNTAIHTRTDGGHPVAELAISRIFSPWFQAGISATYITLSYQDDVAYPGSTAGTYNTVYVGKPLIPVQLFGKATIGGPLHWQSNISLSAGYSVHVKDEIADNGNTLTTKPGVKGGLTAGFKLGVSYFFSCKFGLGASFTGQYFNNSATTMNYHLMALPLTLGIRYRF